MLRDVTSGECRVTLEIGAQIVSLDTPSESVEPPLQARPRPAREFVGAAVLAFKAKRFDDALYAAVELASQAGHGSYPGKAALLRRWTEAALRAGVGGEGVEVLAAAGRLGGLEPGAWPADLAARTQARVASFLADETSAKPLGFYSATEALAAIFRQDRMLMTRLEDPAGADALGALLAAEPELDRAYQAMLALAAGITNPPAAGRASVRPPVGDAALSILVPSRAHETDLLLRLYGDRPIPAGFDLAEELARQIESGELPLAPRPDSGWYAGGGGGSSLPDGKIARWP
jgi:hypothetical protein